jgi:hypothetical protein
MKRSDKETLRSEKITEKYRSGRHVRERRCETKQRIRRTIAWPLIFPNTARVLRCGRLSARPATRRDIYYICYSVYA